MITAQPTSSSSTAGRTSCDNVLFSSKIASSAHDWLTLCCCIGSVVVHHHHQVSWTTTIESNMVTKTTPLICKSSLESGSISADSHSHMECAGYAGVFGGGAWPGVSFEQ